MLRLTTLASAALLLAGQASADETCLADGRGAQCDIFLDDYRNDDVPVGTTNVWATDRFLLEQYGEFRPESALELPGGEDVLYWDGENATIVPEKAGPQLEIADW